MGFNKKIVNKDIIITKFKESGYNGILNYIGKTECLIGVDGQIGDILKIVYSDRCETHKNMEIEKILWH